MTEENEFERAKPTGKILKVLVIVALLTFSGFMIYQNVKTYDHVESRYGVWWPYSVFRNTPNEPVYTYLWVSNIKDCNFSLQFVDDTNLEYSIEIYYYEPGQYLQLERRDRIIDLSGGSNPLRVKSINITLGSGSPYYIGITGDNLNSTVRYSNNANIAQINFHYSASGILRFAFDEGVSRTNMEMECYIDDVDSVYVFVDLPEGVYGSVDFGTGNVFVLESSGWSYSVYGDILSAGETTGFYISIDVTLYQVLYLYLIP